MEVVKLPYSNTRYEHHLIYDEPVNIKSRSAYILLVGKLHELDDTTLLSKLGRYKYHTFRKKLLNKLLKRDGELKCAYCGRNDLILGGNMKYNNKINNLATIDHIVPRCEGGGLCEEENCAVACKDCNCKKGSKQLKEFLN